MSLRIIESIIGAARSETLSQASCLTSEGFAYARWLRPVHMVKFPELFLQKIINDRPCHCNHSKVEMDAYCRSVLVARQRDQCLPPCTISEDVREYVPDKSHKTAEVVAAGFPCQASAFKLQIM